MNHPLVEYKPNYMSSLRISDVFSAFQFEFQSCIVHSWFKSGEKHFGVCCRRRYRYRYVWDRQGPRDAMALATHVNQWGTVPATHCSKTFVVEHGMCDTGPCNREYRQKLYPTRLCVCRQWPTTTTLKTMTDAHTTSPLLPMDEPWIMIFRLLEPFCVDFDSRALFGWRVCVREKMLESHLMTPMASVNLSVVFI
jgi:hypothetical protein